MRIGTREVPARWPLLASLVLLAAAGGLFASLRQSEVTRPPTTNRSTVLQEEAPAETSADETRIYDASGDVIGIYEINDIECQNISIADYVATEGNSDTAYARRVSSGYWRIAEIFPGFPNLGTIRQVGNRWAIRNTKRQLLGFTRGPDAVEAALAYVLWDDSCITR